MKIERDDKNSVNPLVDEHQITTSQEDFQNYYLNEVTGLFVCDLEKDNEVINVCGNENVNLKEVEPRIRIDLKRRNVDILNRYDDIEDDQLSLSSQMSNKYGTKTQTGNKRLKISCTVQSLKKYICCKCDYETNHKNNFQKHFDRVHQKVSHNCSQCDFKTTHEGYLQRHIIKNHTNGVHQKIYHCELCDFKTKWKTNLKTHKSVHENISYLCNQCDYNTKWKANLRMHILGVYGNISVEGPLSSSTPPPENPNKYP